MKGLFVIGTDTEVGKTIVSAALMAAAPKHTRYWKPIQTGCADDSDTKTVQDLARLSPQQVFDKGCRFNLPASPHYAAEQDNARVEISMLTDLANRADAPNTTWVVEGIGGLMVPLSDTVLLPELVDALDLPMLLVASTRLGTINHTLLTAQAIAAHRCGGLGIVLVGDRDPSADSGIEAHSPLPVLGRLPHLDSLTPESIETAGRALLDNRILHSVLHGDGPS